MGNRSIFCLIAACLIVLTGTVGLHAAGPNSHLRVGNDYFDRFDDARALAEYTQAVTDDPSNFEVLTKAAEANLNVGDRLDPKIRGSEAARLEHFRTAERLSRKALELQPNNSRAHFLLAASLGREVSSYSHKDQVATANIIKDEIDRAIALDASNDMAWSALAYWHRTLAEMNGSARFLGGLFFGKIPKGSMDEALKGFRKAVALKPDYCNHHFELARTYVDLKKKDEAAVEFLAGLKCPDLTSMCSRSKESARKDLANLIKSGGVSGTLVAAFIAQGAERGV